MASEYLKSSKPKTFTKEDNINELAKAIRANNISNVNKLIKKINAQKLNQLIDDEYTLLYDAASRGHTKIVERLLNAGANPNVGNIHNQTPLYVASAYNHKEIVELLLNSGANPNIADDRMRTPLFLPSSKGHTKIVELLLKAKANPNVIDEVSATSLELASLHNHIKIVALLLGAGADPNIDDKYGETSLFHAAEEGYSQIVELLLSAGADPNITTNNNESPSKAALDNGHVDIANILKHWKSLNPNELTENGRTTFMDLIIKGYYPEFKHLLSEVDNINARDNNGNTALHYAIKYRKLNMVQDLLANEKINTTIMNNDNKSAYDYAKDIENEDPIYVRVLKDIWDQQMSSKLDPEGLEAKLATLRFYSGKYNKFLLVDPENLTWAEVEDQLYLLNLKNSVYNAIREVQLQLEHHLENGGTLEDFID